MIFMFCLGVLLGYVVFKVSNREKVHGELQIYDSDEGDPYIFLHLFENVKVIDKEKYVTLKVRNNIGTLK